MTSRTRASSRRQGERFAMSRKVQSAVFLLRQEHNQSSGIGRHRPFQAYFRVDTRWASGNQGNHDNAADDFLFQVGYRASASSPCLRWNTRGLLRPDANSESSAPMLPELLLRQVALCPADLILIYHTLLDIFKEECSRNSTALRRGWRLRPVNTCSYLVPSKIAFWNLFSGEVLMRLATEGK